MVGWGNGSAMFSQAPGGRRSNGEEKYKLTRPQTTRTPHHGKQACRPSTGAAANRRTHAKMLEPPIGQAPVLASFSPLEPSSAAYSEVTRLASRFLHSDDPATEIVVDTVQEVHLHHHQRSACGSPLCDTAGVSPSAVYKFTGGTVEECVSWCNRGLPVRNGPVGPAVYLPFVHRGAGDVPVDTLKFTKGGLALLLCSVKNGKVCTDCPHPTRPGSCVSCLAVAAEDAVPEYLLRLASVGSSAAAAAAGKTATRHLLLPSAFRGGASGGALEQTPSSWALNPVDARSPRMPSKHCLKASYPCRPNDDAPKAEATSQQATALLGLLQMPCPAHPESCYAYLDMANGALLCGRCLLGRTHSSPSTRIRGEGRTPPGERDQRSAARLFENIHEAKRWSDPFFPESPEPPATDTSAPADLDAEDFPGEGVHELTRAVPVLSARVDRKRGVLQRRMDVLTGAMEQLKLVLKQGNEKAAVLVDAIERKGRLLTEAIKVSVSHLSTHVNTLRSQCSRTLRERMETVKTELCGTRNQLKAILRAELVFSSPQEQARSKSGRDRASGDSQLPPAVQPPSALPPPDPASRSQKCPPQATDKHRSSSQGEGRERSQAAQRQVAQLLLILNDCTSPVHEAPLHKCPDPLSDLQCLEVVSADATRLLTFCKV